jgi:hypothetical protein
MDTIKKGMAITRTDGERTGALKGTGPRTGVASDPRVPPAVTTGIGGKKGEAR